MADAKALYQQAQDALAAGDEITAYNLYIEAIEEDPDFLDAWVALVALADEDTRPDILEQVERLNPRHPLLKGGAATPSGFDRDTLFDDDVEEETVAARPTKYKPDSFDDDEDDDFRSVIDEDKEASSGLDLQALRERGLDTLTNLQDRFLNSGNADAEVVPGITQRDVRLYGALLSIITLFLCGGTLLIINGRNARTTAEIAAQTAVRGTEVALETRQAEQEANSIQQQTAVVIGQTETRVASFELTLRPTFPPTPTATTTATAEAGNRIAPLPQAEVGVTGVLIGWGGSNPANDGTYRALRIDPVSGQAERMGTRFIEDITVDRNNSLYLYSARNTVDDTFMFRVEVPENISRDLEFPLTNFFRNQGIDSEREMHLAGDRSKFAFIGESAGQDGILYIFDLNTEAITQVTSSPTASYSSPVLSSDGNQVVVVKNDAGNVDLVLIDLNSPSFAETPLTQNSNNIIESFPSFSPDNTQVIYSAATNTDPNNRDLYSLAIIDPAATNNLVLSTPGDEIRPIFGPTGRFIAYSSTEATEAYNIFLFDLVTQTKYQITEEDRNPFFIGSWLAQF